MAWIFSQTSYDYEDPGPNGGCNAGEIRAHIEGITGVYCAPQCYKNDSCTLNRPPNVTAIPVCLLEDPNTHVKYCALTCTAKVSIALPQADECGSATCRKLSSVGIDIDSQISSNVHQDELGDHLANDDITTLKYISADYNVCLLFAIAWYDMWWY